MSFTAEIDVTTKDDGGLPRAFDRGKAAITGVNAAYEQLARAAESAGGKVGEEWRNNEKAVKAFERTLEQLQLKQAREAARHQMQGFQSKEIYGPDVGTYREEHAASAERLRRLNIMRFEDEQRSRSGWSNAVHASAAANYAIDNRAVQYGSEVFGPDATQWRIDQSRRVDAARTRQARADAINASVVSSRQHDAEWRAGIRSMFSTTDISTGDIANLGQGDQYRRLQTGSRFRAYDFERSQQSSLLGGVGRFGRDMLSGLGAPLGGAAIGFAAYEIQRSNREFIAKTDAAAESFDILARRLNIQADLRGGDSLAARTRVEDIALSRGRDKEFAYNVGTQMVSSGFSAGEATGGSLNAMLKLFNSMPAAGGAPINEVQLAEAFTSYLTSQNMAKNEENVTNVGAAVQQFFKETNLGVSDFSELAGQADVFRGKLSVQEQLSSFSVLRDVGKTAEEATTALRQVVIQASTAGGNNEAKEWLAKGGLKPQDVDFHGESLGQILERLAGAKEKMDPAAFDIMLSKTFGDRQVASITRLMEDRSKVADRASRMGDRSAFEEDVKEMESGPEAARKRQTLQRERWMKDHAHHDGFLRDEMAQQARERGESNFRVEARQKQFDLYRGMGVERDTAAAAAFGDYGLGVGGTERVEAAKRSLAEKGMMIDPAIRDVLGDQARKEWRDRGHGEWVASDPFDRTGNYTIGEAENVLPQMSADEAKTHQGQVKAELERKQKAGLLGRAGGGRAGAEPAGNPQASVSAPRLESQGDRQVQLLEQMVVELRGLRGDRPAGASGSERPWQSPPTIPPPRSTMLSQESRPS